MAKVYSFELKKKKKNLSDTSCSLFILHKKDIFYGRVLLMSWGVPQSEE